jgi:hypothetical protein
MKIFRFIGIALCTFVMCVNLASCGGNSSNNTQEGQKALDAAVKKHGNAADIQYRYLEQREYYKSQGDQKNADYYDRMAKEQAKEVERLRQEREKIRKDTYGDVFK